MEKIPEVEQSDCIGCVQCSDNLPQVFAMNEDDLAFVHNPYGAPEDAIQQEIDTCPTECIIWLEV